MSAFDAYITIMLGCGVMLMMLGGLSGSIAIGAVGMCAFALVFVSLEIRDILNGKG